MAYATTCCMFVALDAAAKPLRPAPMWMDVRAHAGQMPSWQLARPPQTQWRWCRASIGGMDAPQSPGFKRHQPDIFHQATSICEYQDYLTLRLTGVRCASLNM